MRRRGFLQLAGAAVLGVLTAKVPVFAEEYPLAPRGLATLIDSPPGSMWAYPVHYMLPIEVPANVAEWVTGQIHQMAQRTGLHNINQEGFLQ